jgi:hypothetical protein
MYRFVEKGDEARGRRLRRVERGSERARLEIETEAVGEVAR